VGRRHGHGRLTVKIAITAEDDDGLRSGWDAAWRHRDKLTEPPRLLLRDGYFLVAGTTETVRDMVVYGTPDNVKVRVGPAQPTPDWMKE
jgi:hypothetical protein